MVDCHNYGDYPCGAVDCNFVAYSKKCLNLHSRMHTRRVEKVFWFKCPKRGCQSSFQFQSLLDDHLRIHNNDVRVCMYCPYRYAKYDHYQTHLRTHFEMREFKCDQCNAKFTTQSKLNIHYSRHEGLTYSCLICKTYETTSKSAADSHLRNKHAKVFGKNVNVSDSE